MGRDYNQLLERAVSPHPAEDRLFDRWEHALSRPGASHETPSVMALEMAVTWLDELKLRIAAGNPRAIYEHAALLPESRQDCDCLYSPNTGEYRWLRYFHSSHEVYNRAVWEILDMVGLMEWMRLELEFDLASPNAEQPDYGRCISHKFGQSLRGFFQPEAPSKQWTDPLWHISHA